jgi:hypothetical protein
MKLEGMNFKRRLAITTAGLLVVAVAVFAFWQWGGGTANGPSPNVAALPTYPADFFTGNVACGDELLKNIRLSVTADQAPVGHAVSTASPPTVDSRPLSFVWPQGYSIRRSDSRMEVVGPGGTPVLTDGVIIGTIGVCSEGNGTFMIATINPTPAP